MMIWQFKLKFYKMLISLFSLVKGVDWINILPGELGYGHPIVRYRPYDQITLPTTN
jgi:hypothetical protein